jgi:hypothetical protein
MLTFPIRAVRRALSNALRYDDPSAAPEVTKYFFGVGSTVSPHSLKTGLHNGVNYTKCPAINKQFFAALPDRI